MATVSQNEEKDLVSDEDFEHWHAEDFQAGRIVVGLMTGVFVAGLFLYAIICWIVM